MSIVIIAGKGTVPRERSSVSEQEARAEAQEETASVLRERSSAVKQSPRIGVKRATIAQDPPTVIPVKHEADEAEEGDTRIINPTVPEHQRPQETVEGKETEIVKQVLNAIC